MLKRVLCVYMFAWYVVYVCCLRACGVSVCLLSACGVCVACACAVSPV